MKPTEKQIEGSLFDICGMKKDNFPPPPVPKGTLIGFAPPGDNSIPVYKIDPLTGESQCLFSLWDPRTSPSITGFIPIPFTNQFFYWGTKTYGWVNVTTGLKYDFHIDEGLWVASPPGGKDNKVLGLDDEPRYNWRLFQLDPKFPGGMLVIAKINATKALSFTKSSRLIWSNDGSTLYAVGLGFIVEFSTSNWRQNRIYDTDSYVDFGYLIPGTNTLVGVRRTVYSEGRLSIIDITTGRVKPGDGAYICNNCDIFHCVLADDIFSCFSRGLLYHININTLVLNTVAPLKGGQKSMYITFAGDPQHLKQGTCSKN
jgi:hypothetical protein